MSWLLLRWRRVALQAAEFFFNTNVSIFCVKNWLSKTQHSLCCGNVRSYTPKKCCVCFCHHCQRLPFVARIDVPLPTLIRYHYITVKRAHSQNASASVWVCPRLCGDAERGAHDPSSLAQHNSGGATPNGLSILLPKTNLSLMWCNPP